jgi:membrane protein YqaA with SNARE-associated domain
MNPHQRNISAVRWFVGFGVYVLAMLLLAYWAGAHGRDALRNLVSFVIFVSFACQFCPLPIIPAFLAISRNHNPFLIAFLGSCATCIANLHDYYILTSLMRWERLEKAKDTHWYKRAITWFGKYPFWTLAVANLLPLPIDVPRLLAISSGYNRLLFTLATFVGRVPRYLLLAWLGYELKLSNTAILIVLAATLALAGIKLIPQLKDKWIRK